MGGAHQGTQAVPEHDVAAIEHRSLAVESQRRRRGPLLRRQYRGQVLEHQEPHLSTGMRLSCAGSVVCYVADKGLLSLLAVIRQLCMQPVGVRNSGSPDVDTLALTDGLSCRPSCEISFINFCGVYL